MAFVLLISNMSVCFLGFSFGNTGVRTLGLTLARQMLLPLEPLPGLLLSFDNFDTMCHRVIFFGLSCLEICGLCEPDVQISPHI
jgi:hypothetical protein